MATRIVTVIIDDLTGKEVEDGETVHMGLDGTEYVIDLSAANAKKLRAALAKYIDAGRPVVAERPAARKGGVGRERASEGSAARKAELAAMRAWAKENGYAVAERGRVSGDIQAMYRLQAGS